LSLDVQAFQIFEQEGQGAVVFRVGRHARRNERVQATYLTPPRGTGARLADRQHQFERAVGWHLRVLRRAIGPRKLQLQRAAVRRGVETARLVAPSRLVTVPNGVALPAPSPRMGPLRAGARLSPDDLVVGCVARLSPEKGLDDLLRAAALLRPRWPRLVVLVVGDAPTASQHPEELRRLAASLGLGTSVRFCGYQPDAARLCAEFDIQVVCSRAEPCGLATLEAMAQGRPLVATASGGSPELVDDGVEGFLVPPQDPGRLAGRLECLLDSPGLRREMGRRGRARVLRDFGLDLMVERTEAVYRLALEGAGG